MIAYVLQVLIFHLSQFFLFRYLYEAKFSVNSIMVDEQRTLVQAVQLLGAVLIQLSLFGVMFNKTYLKKFIKWMSKPRQTLHPLLGLLALTIPFILYLIYFYVYPGEYNGFTFNSFFLIVVFFFLGALAEEMIFRGYFFRLLINRNKKRALIYIIGQAALFAFFHYYTPGYTPIRLFVIFIAGILLGLIAIKGFMYAVVFHFLWNFLQAYFLGLEVAGYTFSNSFNTIQHAVSWESNIYSAVLLVAVIAVYLAYYFKDRRKFI